MRRHIPPRILPAVGLVIAGLLAPTATAVSAALPDSGPPPVGAPPGQASLSHSAAKATTFTTATILANLVIFSAGTGSVVGGSVLTAFNITKSFLLVTANDYAWDTYLSGNSSKDKIENFDEYQHLWRTTEKFLTYKPLSTAIKFASIFVYTGSVPVMLAYGTASEAVNAGIFFLNDLSWDLYDRSQPTSGPADDEMLERPPALKPYRLHPAIAP